MVALAAALVYPTAGGLLYGMMTSLSKSTVPAIIVHMSYNTWMFLSDQGSLDVLALPIGVLIAVIGLSVWWFFDMFRANAGGRLTN
jgi:membrane protease YdiL (CAAX protease family)